MQIKYVAWCEATNEGWKLTVWQSTNPHRQGDRARHRGRLQGTYAPPIHAHARHIPYSLAQPAHHHITNYREIIQADTATIGLADKGARRREGGHPTCTAALDLRRQANVRVPSGSV
jgi:hypothetical protein